MAKVITYQVGSKLYITNGVDPVRYVDLTTNKVHQYKPSAWRRLKQLFRKSKPYSIYYKDRMF